MRHISLLAMVAAIVLTAGLVVVFGGPRSYELPEIVEMQLAQPPDVDATTTTVFVLFETLVGSDPTAGLEDELLDDAMARASTTTTLEAMTTTTLVPASRSSSPPATSPPTTSPPATSPPTTVSSAGYRSNYEADFHSSINSLRSLHGFGGLTRNGSLDSRAREWAKHMAANGKLVHSSLGSLVPPWSAAGENIGKGGSSPAIFTALVNSPGHLSNMLGNYTHIGLGVWQDASGTLWVVNVFTR